MSGGWWSGLRARPWTSVLMACLSVLAVLTATLTPLLVRAIGESTMSSTVAAAGVDATALTLRAGGDQSSDPDQTLGAITSALQPVPAADPIWSAPQTWVESLANVAWAPSGQDTGGETYARIRVAGTCAGITLTAGRCPTQVGETLVSTGDLGKRQLRVGGDLLFRTTGVGDGALTVVGSYDADRVSTPLTRPGGGAVPTVTGDPLITSAGQLQELPLFTQINGRVTLLRAPTLGEEVDLRRSVDLLNSSALQQQTSLIVDTRLPDVLDRIADANRATTVLVGLVAVQALGLALFALAVVAQRLSRARAAEWGVGRLLGLGPRRWLPGVYAEPMAALLAGVPIGVLAAVGVAQASARTQLQPGTRLDLASAPVWIAVGATIVLSLACVVAVSAPAVRLPLAELVSERTEARQVSRLGAVAQAAAVLLGAASLYTLLAGGVITGTGSLLALLAPGLLTLALAVIAVRVAVLVVRRLTRRPARSLAGLVVGRQIARTPTMLNPAMLLAVGMAVAVTATQLQTLSVRNQELRARATVGAATVLQVDAPTGTDLVRAVRQADPTGRFAMAAREVTPAQTGPRVVAVDSTRLAAVSSWSPAWAEVGDLASALKPPVTAAITLTGQRVRIDLSDVSLMPGPPASSTLAPADPVLVLQLDTGRTWATVRTRPVSGSNRLEASIPCSAGCRVRGLGLASKNNQPYRASITVTSVSTDTQPAADARGWLTDQHRWQVRAMDAVDATSSVSAVPVITEAGLTLNVRDDAGGSDAVALPTDVTQPMPALLGPSTTLPLVSGLPNGAQGYGLSGNDQLVTIVGRAAVLPRLLGDGLLVDLGNAAALSNPASVYGGAEVWLASDAPPGIESALTTAGLKIDGRQRLADVTASKLREPTTRSVAVGVWLALSALLLALVAGAAARVIDAQRRRADWRSLRDAGQPTARLRRLVALEVMVPALVAVVLGTGAGILAVTLTAPRIPLVDLSQPGPPLQLAISWPVVGLLVGAVIVVLALLAGLAAWREPAPGRRAR